jgi:hypothetical protein
MRAGTIGESPTRQDLVCTIVRRYSEVAAEQKRLVIGAVAVFVIVKAEMNVRRAFGGCQRGWNSEGSGGMHDVR